jgi:hypothetical protein
MLIQRDFMVHYKNGSNGQVQKESEMFYYAWKLSILNRKRWMFIV